MKLSCDGLPLARAAFLITLISGIDEAQLRVRYADMRSINWSDFRPSWIGKDFHAVEIPIQDACWIWRPACDGSASIDGFADTVAGGHRCRDEPASRGGAVWRGAIDSDTLAG